MTLVTNNESRIRRIDWWKNRRLAKKRNRRSTTGNGRSPSEFILWDLELTFRDHLNSKFALFVNVQLENCLRFPTFNLTEMGHFCRHEVELCPFGELTI